MIKCTTEIDEISQKSLSKYTKIYSIISLVVGSVGLLVYLILGTIFDNQYLDFLLLFSIPFGFGLVFLITLNKNIKNMTNNNFVNSYEFDTDYFNVATSKNGEVVGTQKIYYNNIHKVIERDCYLFIYINKVNAFIVNKNNLSAEDLRYLKELLKIN